MRGVRRLQSGLAPRARTMTPPSVKLRFWGVRGSTPTAEPGTWRYGGNTPCVELLTPDGAQFILDCGTGLRMLGNRWANPDGANAPGTHIFVTHYHWDHIQGLPFFAPLYDEKNAFHFYSFRSKFLGRNSLKQVLETQMELPYFPVNLSAMNAKRIFREVSGGESFELDGVKITARWLHHPQGCLGYRFETSAGTIVYATDNEPGNPELDASLRELAAGADIFINDAQYSPEELLSARRGWGHSSWQEGVRIAREVGAKTLVLFHHDPDSADRKVDDTLRQARQQYESVFAASEGMTMTLAAPGEAQRVEVDMPRSRAAPRRETQLRANVCGTTDDGRSFEEETVVRDLSLQGALIFLRHSPRLQSELHLTMESPGTNGTASMRLRGYVVRIGGEEEKGRAAVGVIFTD
jgi:phosphoribosyl 1,2-cyclic phosphodiesterase